MNSRDIIGKRIVGVRQGRIKHRTVGPGTIAVEAIILEDGRELRFSTIETDYGEYAHNVTVVKPMKKEGV